MKMTRRKRYILQQLCKCDPKTGIVLSEDMKRTAQILISDGLAYSIIFGNIEIFIATTAGRQALPG